MAKEIAAERKPKIFISHNQADSDYARHLVNLLHHIGVSYSDIFCSSYPGCDIPFGKSILDAIRGQYDEYDLMMLFIHSPRYYQSPVSLCEMGAAWILRNEVYSFLTPDCEFSMLRGVITADMIAFHPNNTDAPHRLNEFRAIVERKFALRPLHPSIWESLRTDFLTAVKK